MLNLKIILKQHFPGCQGTFDQFYFHIFLVFNYKNCCRQRIYEIFFFVHNSLQIFKFNFQKFNETEIRYENIICDNFIKTLYTTYINISAFLSMYKQLNCIPHRGILYDVCIIMLYIQSVKHSKSFFFNFN